MSTTAKVRSMTDQLVADLQCGPHEHPARDLARAASRVAESLEAMHSVVSAIAPALAVFAEAERGSPRRTGGLLASTG